MEMEVNNNLFNLLFADELFCTQLLDSNYQPHPYKYK